MNRPGQPNLIVAITTSNLGIEFLLRLALETGVVLLPGEGFEVVDPTHHREYFHDDEARSVEPIGTRSGSWIP